MFLVGRSLGHVHMQPGAVLAGEFDGFFKQVVVYGKGGVQPHVALAA